MQVEQWAIGAVIPPRQGQQSYLARVDFSVKPGDMYPAKVVESYQKDGEWKDVMSLEITGATRIRVPSAFLKRSAKGQVFLQCPLDLSWDDNRAIAEDALLQLNDAVARREAVEQKAAKK